MEKLKKYWWAVIGAIGAVLAFIVAIVSRRKFTPPARPKLPDVKTPEAPKVEDRPSDKYEEAAKKITDPHDRVAAGNERYR